MLFSKNIYFIKFMVLFKSQKYLSCNILEFYIVRGKGPNQNDVNAKLLDYSPPPPIHMRLFTDYVRMQTTDRT